MGCLWSSQKRNPTVTSDPNAPKELKLVLVGDTTVGKSCLIINYQQQIFSEDYEPTCLDVFRGTKNF